MRVFLVRHGAVAPPRPAMFYGGSDVPLSPEGEAEARRAAQLLAPEPLDRIVCSPLSRARFGAECVQAGRDGVPIHIEPDLREIDRGRWVGLTPDEIEAQFPGDLRAHEEDPDEWRAHGGESMGDLQQRVLSTFAKLEAEYAGAQLAIVAHLWPVKSILADILGQHYSTWKQIKVPTASVSCIERTSNGWQVAWSGRKPVATTDER